MDIVSNIFVLISFSLPSINIEEVINSRYLMPVLQLCGVALHVISPGVIGSSNPVLQETVVCVYDILLEV